ncbi:MAG: hypothetical protein KJP04_05815 [Arenicella sp.]|nr:hypothetical protein [Arenicella sp.]
MHRWSIGALLALVVLVLIYFVAQSAGRSLPEPKLLRTISDGLRHPTEMIYTNGEFWLAQLRDSQLYTLSDVAGELKPVDSVAPIASPHFMAADKRGVYISEGRGDSIRFYAFDGSANGEAVDVGLTLNRPHGLCIDKAGWLYIADSVNSRLLRHHLRDGTTQVFADHARRIAYGRQILCRDDGLWLSNSYEKAFPLNPGQGGNVLRITDFDSGESEVILAFPGGNVTGLTILDDRLLLVGRWWPVRDIQQFDLREQRLLEPLFASNIELDAPYGMFADHAKRRLYITFLGVHPKRSPGSQGVIQEWRF